MRIGTTEECTSFLDALRDRGARGVKLAFAPDGAVTGLELAFAPPAPAAHSPKRQRAQEDDDPAPRARIPAGLGYSGV
jgi:hypothetical protein